jgi:hypothetical protein
MRKAISVKDRFEALSRIAEYREEWEQYEKFRASGAKSKEDGTAESMCRKWGIRAPFPPFFVRSVSILEGSAVEIVNGIHQHAPPLRDNRHIQAVASAAAKRGNHSADHWLDRPEIEGDFLYLKIDITAPDSVLIGEFKKLLSRYSSGTRIKGGGSKKKSQFIVNKWELFDTCQTEAATPYQLANVRIEKGTVAEINNYRIQAEKALKEANQIINSIRKTASLT